MKTLHEQLVLAIHDTDTLTGDEPIVTVEADDRETLIRRTDDIDQNIEVIYVQDGEVALIQEHGEDGKDRNAFVWTNEGWQEDVIKKYVIPWLASV